MKRTVVSNSGGFALLWALIILLLCSAPGRFIPSAGWMELLSADKFVHAGIFFVLSCLVIIHSVRKNWSAGACAALLVTVALYGFVLEILQATLFSGRSFELLDALANGTGVLIVLALRTRLLRWAFS